MKVAQKTSMNFGFTFVVGLVCIFISSTTSGQISEGEDGNSVNPCRRPSHVTTAPSPGDNGYKIQIDGASRGYKRNLYKPGELYDVILLGTSSQFYVRKFIGFILTAEGKEEENFISPTPNAGSFDLLGNPLLKFSESCPNAVAESSLFPKSEVLVSWRAPPPGTGCIVFRASVQENIRWYMGDGLDLELCEDRGSPVDDDQAKGCCACGEAKYELIFEGLWSKRTHPKDFPTNEWLTHFSDIIGASHSQEYRMWGNDDYASDGVKDVAEKGATRKLEAELKAKSNKIHSIFKVGGLWHPNVNGKAIAEFNADDQHHLVSMLTMLSPSSDWIVGIDSLDLCLENCSWVTENSLDLYLWDAGTSEGVTYMSRGQPTVPQEKIHRINSSFPTTSLSPFYDPSGAPMKPMAHLTLKRQNFYEKACGERSHKPLTNLSQEDEKVMIGCSTSEWTRFSPCSVNCGDGFKMRSRHYLDPMKAKMNDCSIRLVDKEPCQETCMGNISCKTTEWEEWSECSVTCGKGRRSRSRKFLDYKARKVCPVEITQTDHCMGMKPACENPETVDPLCAVTPWSHWSPCTVTCGEGLKIQTRFYIDPSSVSICNVELMQKAPCFGAKATCELDMAETKAICMLPKEVGPCRGYFPRWHFDASRLICEQFIYGGCRGNLNNFEQERNCLQTCSIAFPEHISEIPLLTVTAVDSEPEKISAINCMVTPWSQWSACSHFCGNAHQERRRMVKVHPENGGEPCPKRLVQRRRCKNLPRCSEPSAEHHLLRLSDPDTIPEESLDVIDCMVTPWSDWTPCSHTCGDGQQERRRMIKVNPENGGRPCPQELIERRRCRNISNCLVASDKDSMDVDCILSAWSEWAPCSETCGEYAFMERIRTIIQHPRNNGAPCNHRVQRKYCRLLPSCPR